MTTGGLGFRIEHLWAYLAVHADGDEGVSSFRTPGGVWLPMIGADQDRIQSLHPHVERLARASRVPIVLTQFGSRTDLETIEP